MRYWPAVVLVVAGTHTPESVAAQAPAIAIRNVTLLTGGTVAPMSHATIVVQGRTIVALGPTKTVRIPSGARVIDGSGKYLIPGLIDTHVHIAWMVGTPAMDTQVALELASGITGHRDAGGVGHERELVAFRSRIDAGDVLAPRLYVTGSGSSQNVVRYQADGVADLIRKLAVVGVNGIKLRNTTAVQADTVIAAARAAGLPAFGHTYGGGGGVPPGDFTLRAIDDGAAGVMHVSGIGPAGQLVSHTIAATGWQRQWLVSLYLRWTDASAAEEERLLQRMIGTHTWLEPNFTADAFLLHDEWYRGRPELRFIAGSYDSLRMGFPEFRGGDLALAREGWDRMQCFVRRFQDAGGLVLAGTDMLPWPGGIHEELRLLVLAGLSQMEALQVATRNAAQALGWGARTGTIAVGMDADLLLLDADPLLDITNTTRIRAVVRAGHLLDRTALDSLLSVAAVGRDR